MSSDKKDLFAVRDAQADDLNFIMATFLRGLYYGGSCDLEEIPKAVFMLNYHRVIEHILKSPGVQVKIACLREDPEVILGYAIYRSLGGVTVLDWIFVKTAWRKLGIAKQLLPQKIDAVTHLTKMGKSLKPQGCDYNPFLL